MDITNADKTNCANLVRVLKRAKVELDGIEEILGTAEVVKWLASLSARIDADLKEQEEAKKVAQSLSSVVVTPGAESEKPKRKKKGEQ